jgi:FkbM family methyltransferase
MIRFSSRVVSNLQAETTGIGLWLRDRLRPGDNVVDIGANVGAYTSLAADLVGAAGHVYAIEPGPENVSALQDKFRDRPNVTVIAAAAGDRAGTVSLFLDRRDGRRHSVASDNVGKAGGSIQVEQISLDDAFGTLPHLAAIKIDAQGAEHHILRGGHRVLRNLKPALALELWPQGLINLGATARDVLDALALAGYDVHRLSAKGKLKPKRFIDDFLAEASHWNSINLAALPSRREGAGR